MDKLRARIRAEYDYDEADPVNTEQIGRWFLGL
jgi:hypothetical protein